MPDAASTEAENVEHPPPLFHTGGWMGIGMGRYGWHRALGGTSLPVWF